MDPLAASDATDSADSIFRQEELVGNVTDMAEASAHRLNWNFDSLEAKKKGGNDTNPYCFINSLKHAP